jgi:predicted CxxxxCH...CXXCH cytochrome family protein
MGNKRESRTQYSQTVLGILLSVAVVTALTFNATITMAAGVLNSCTTYCHGAPPNDAPRKGNLHFNSQSSAFTGSHRTHLPAVPAIVSCSVCHVPVTSAGFGHQNNVINMANSLKGYSSAVIRAKYNKGVFFNQTSIPLLTNASCSNVNCHFEKQTPLWGSGAAATTCETCHGALVVPLTPAHPKHVVALGNTITSCASCHNNYSGAAAYNHATSAGRAIAVKGGTYAGSNNRYLPSQTGRVTGNCSSFVCHGSATGVPWSGTLWSTTDQCAKCHASTAAGAVTAAVPFYSTAYPTKVTATTDAKVGAHTNHMTSQTLGISASTACSDCHGTVTLTGTTHMTGTTTFVWSALATRNAALAPAYTAATGQCTATYCHGNAMPGGDTSGSNKSPAWKDPNYLPATVTAAACAVCHGFPPTTTSGHPVATIPTGFPATAAIGTTCSCHSNVSSTGTSYATMFVNPALHINGIFEPAASGHVFPYGGSVHLSAAGVTPWSACTGCHTNAAGGTYPVATGTAPNCTGCHIQGLRAPTGTSSCWDCHGASSTNGTPVGNVFPNISGNHRIHVAITGTTCATCHNGGGNGTAAHGSSNRIAATAASVKVTFTGQGAAPLWTLATKSCSATNCHGQGAPTWGARTGALVNGFPYSSVQCAKCHSGNLATDVTAAKPFYSTAIPQVTLATTIKVGAHTSHLTSTDSLAAAFTCDTCHGAVTLTSTTHMNGTTNFTWSTLATKSGALTPTYTATTGVCANVYCHGASMPGGDITGTNRAPVWNVAFLSATLSRAACASCHGFPPATTSGHPAVTIPATWPATGAVTGALGTTCNCHANISSTGTTYATIFVNKALHIDGVLQVSGGHAVPYDTHKADVVAAGGNTACLGCHAMGTAASLYPAAVAGNPPDCMSCHIKAAPVHTGTVAGANCSSCHGLSTATTTKIGRPVGTAYPDRLGYHSGASDGAHGTAVCTVCHVGAGTTSGNNSGINHGKGSTAGPVRNGKPNVVGPMVNGITPTTSAKGVGTPANGTTCNHGTISSSCSGGGTKTNRW